MMELIGTTVGLVITRPLRRLAIEMGQVLWGNALLLIYAPIK
jgi:hypothetical protein